MMSKCPICDKEVSDWKHPLHLASNKHREALALMDECGEKSDEGPQCDEKGWKDSPPDTIFDVMIESFEVLCKKKIISGITRVNAFSLLINYIMQERISDENLKTLHRLRTVYF